MPNTGQKIIVFSGIYIASSFLVAWYLCTFPVDPGWAIFAGFTLGGRTLIPPVTLWVFNILRVPVHIQTWFLRIAIAICLFGLGILLAGRIYAQVETAGLEVVLGTSMLASLLYCHELICKLSAVDQVANARHEV